MKKIMIVDDNPAIRDLLSAALRQHNLNVSTAFDGHSALHRVAVHNPELLILDIEMPDMSGFEVLEKIREQAIYADMKIIILTANYNPSRDARSELADVVMSKPFNLRELVNIIEKLLSGTNKYVTV